MRRPLAIGCILVVLLSVPAAGAAARSSADTQCSPQTGKCVEGRFLAYWNAHGGLAINGYPLSDERQEKLEDGQYYAVQWFERVRMEYHPENADPQYQVLLGQFGRSIHPADPPAAEQPGATYFAATGHNVAGRFLAYWEQNGGLAQFGYPLSEVFHETLENGQAYDVQYFERARFEYHPENAAPSDVLLGQFGRRLLNAPWGPVLTPLPNGTLYTDPQGRFTASVPSGWARQDASPNSVFFRAPELWGVELALNDGSAFSVIDQADAVIDSQVRQRPNYRLLSLDKVNIGPHRAFRRVFQHTNDEGMTEIIVRIYFLSGPWLYNANGFMLPQDFNRVAPLIDGIAGSIVTTP
jgi:hypothetical protein